jgi:pimeloyl-ACP methyl ester carboxylesterase
VTQTLRKRLLTSLLLLGALGAAGPARVQERAQRVTFQTADGHTIAASLYEPARRPVPAVILVHMLGRSRRDWEPAAARLAADGFAALAIDLRGHGESVLVAGGEQAQTSYVAMVADVKGARRFLDTRAEILRDRIGLAGASLGATLVVAAAAEDRAIRSIALLSPSLDYRGFRIEGAMRKYGSRPALLVASREDPYAWRSMRELAKDQSEREMVLLEGAGHGTTMLTRDESLARTLVDWFRRTLL